MGFYMILLSIMAKNYCIFLFLTFPPLLLKVRIRDHF